MNPPRFETLLVLLFPTVADAGLVDGQLEPLEQLAADQAKARMGQLRDVELAVLGSAYLESRRMERRPMGRIRDLGSGEDGLPEYADVFLVTHIAGVALWEAWLPAPTAPLDASRYIGWLDPESEGGPAAAVRAWIARIDPRVARPAAASDAFACTILRSPGEAPSLDEIVAAHGPDIVRVLYLDRSRLPFKRAVVAAELERDFCLRDRGISLLSRRGAIDLRTGEGMPRGADGIVLPARSALPLLVAIELLILERAVLRLFHERISADQPTSVRGLLDLKAQVLSGLEEYRGTVATSNRFSDEVTAYGQRVLGIDDLYRALVDKLDGITFEITTRYQQTTNVLEFWLTVLITAVSASSLAASVAAVAFAGQPLAMLVSAVGVGLATAVVVAVLLRGRLE